MVIHAATFDLRSPNYPLGYPTGVDCIYIVHRLAASTCFVQMEFADFQLETSQKCHGDWLLMDRRRYCGVQPPRKGQPLLILTLTLFPFCLCLYLSASVFLLLYGFIFDRFSLAFLIDFISFLLCAIPHSTFDLIFTLSQRIPLVFRPCKGQLTGLSLSLSLSMAFYDTFYFFLNIWKSSRHIRLMRSFFSIDKITP